MTTFAAKLRPVVLAILDSLDAEMNRWDEDRWQRFLHVVDEVGRLTFDLPSHFTYDADLMGAVEDAAGTIADAQVGVMEAVAILRSVALQPPADVSEPASNYSSAIPAPEPEAPADPAITDDVPTESPPASRPAADISSDGMGPEEADRQPTEAPAAANPPSHQRPSSGVDGASPPPALVPLTVEALTANGHVPLSPRQREVLDAYREAGGNQRAAAERLGTSTGAVSGTLYQLRGSGRLPGDIADLMASAAWKRTGRPRPEEKAPAPMRDGHAEMVLRAEADAQRIAHGIAERARAAAPDVVAARDADDSKHRDRAKAKADQVWRERHPEQA